MEYMSRNVSCGNAHPLAGSKGCKLSVLRFEFLYLDYGSSFFRLYSRYRIRTYWHVTIQVRTSYLFPCAHTTYKKMRIRPCSRHGNYSIGGFMYPRATSRLGCLVPLGVYVYTFNDMRAQLIT